MNAYSNPQNKTHTIKTIGILGGGQLGMMMAQSALKLGMKCVFLEDAKDAPANLYGQVYTNNQLDDFAKTCDVFTLEFENTPVQTALFLSNLTNQRGFFPAPNVLEIAQDRLAEKSLFRQLGIETVPFMAVNSFNELQTACDNLGLPLVMMAKDNLLSKHQMTFRPLGMPLVVQPPVKAD